jgi:hypothetical protein
MSVIIQKYLVTRDLKATLAVCEFNGETRESIYKVYKNNAPVYLQGVNSDVLGRSQGAGAWADSFIKLLRKSKLKKQASGFTFEDYKSMTEE